MNYENIRYILDDLHSKTREILNIFPVANMEDIKERYELGLPFEAKILALWWIGYAPYEIAIDADTIAPENYIQRTDPDDMLILLKSKMTISKVLEHADDYRTWIETDEEVLDLLGKRFVKKTIDDAIKWAINIVVKELQPSHIEKEPQKTRMDALDVELSVILEREKEDAYILDRLYNESSQVIDDMVKRDWMDKSKSVLAKRGMECFKFTYIDGLDDDTSALRVKKMFDTDVSQPAILKNMNKIYIQQVLGYAGEKALHGYVIPSSAKHLGGENEPDFIQWDEDEENIEWIAEVKFRKKTGKEQTIEWFLSNECKYLKAYLDRGIMLKFYYVIYNRGYACLRVYTIIG